MESPDAAPVDWLIQRVLGFMPTLTTDTFDADSVARVVRRKVRGGPVPGRDGPVVHLAQGGVVPLREALPTLALAVIAARIDERAIVLHLDGMARRRRYSEEDLMLAAHTLDGMRPARRRTRTSAPPRRLSPVLDATGRRYV